MKAIAKVQSKSKPKLARKLGFGLVAIYGLGNIVGAGIYALVGKVAGEAGQATPWAFVFAMVVASFSALSFAEFSSRRPYSEGSTAYISAGFKNRNFTILVGMLMGLATVVSAAALARAFGGYLNAATGLSTPIGAALIIIIFGLLVSWGIEESAKVSAIHTIIELVGLAVIIWFGRSSIVNFASSDGIATSLQGAQLTGVVAGVFLAFYAFIGVEDMVHLAEETKRPRTAMPLAIVSALLIATVFYVLVSIVTISYVPIAELNQSNAPLSLVFQQITNLPGWVIALIALTAAAGGVLAHIISGSRLLFGMSERGLIHKSFGKVLSKRRAPFLAILVVVVIAACLAIIADLKVLATATSFLVLILFALVNAALIALKRSARSTEKKPIFKVPMIVPIMGLITSIALVAFQLVTSLAPLLK